MKYSKFYFAIIILIACTLYLTSVIHNYQKSSHNSSVVSNMLIFNQSALSRPIIINNTSNTINTTLQNYSTSNTIETSFAKNRQTNATKLLDSMLTIYNSSEIQNTSQSNLDMIKALSKNQANTIITDLGSNSIRVRAQKLNLSYGSILQSGVLSRAGSTLYYFSAPDNTISNITEYEVNLKKAVPDLRIRVGNYTVNSSTSTIRLLSSSYTKIGNSIILNHNYTLNLNLSSLLLGPNKLNYTYSIYIGNTLYSSSNTSANNISKRFVVKNIPLSDATKIIFKAAGNANYSSVDPTVYYTSANANLVISASETLSSDLICGSLTINSGVVLTTDGHSILCSGTIINNGAIDTGNPNNGGAGGQGTVSVLPGSPGGSATSSYGGSGGGGATASAQGTDSSSNGGMGGNTTIAGGAGAVSVAGSAGVNGGAGSTPPTPTLSNTNISNMYSGNFSSYLVGAGGGGGSSGKAGGTSYNGGNGGSGSYGLYIQANSITTGTINASGLSGLSGISGNASAGGGGGAGGFLILAYNGVGTAPSTSGVNVSGGAGGAGGSKTAKGKTYIGGNGGAGGAGQTLIYNYGTSPPILVLPQTIVSTFVENGLPSGTSWSVTYGGVQGSSTTNTISITTSTGLESYSIPSQVSGGVTYAANPSSGSVVAGNTTTATFAKSLSTPTISPSSAQVSPGQTVTFSSTWSGGNKPYGASLYSSSTSTCTQGSTLMQQSIGLTSNSITFNPVSPTSSTYYCVFVTDNSSNPSTTGSITAGVAGPIGVGFSPSGTYAYVGQGSNVLIVNTASNSVSGSIAIGFNSVYDVAFSPSGTYAYAVNYGSNNVSIINTATNSVTGYITTGFSLPEGVSFAPSGTYSYVANYGSSNIVIINTATNSVTGAITTGVSNPEGVAFSPSGTYAYATYHGGTDNAIIIDTSTNSVVGDIRGKFGVPSAATFAPSGMFSYIINEGSIGIFSNVSIIDAVTNTVVSSFENSGTPDLFNKVAFSPSGTYAYMTSSSGKNITIVNTGTLTTNSVDSLVSVIRPKGIFLESGLPSNSMWNVTYNGVTGFQSVGTWSSATSYPITDEFPGCVANNGYIYCVGGDENTVTPVNTVYYANILSTNALGQWATTNPYPLSAVGGANCVTSGSYIYCVGGLEGTAAAPTNAVYYGTLSASGVSSWTKTTSYPISIYLDSCDTYNSYIYCVGGNTTTSSGYDTNSVYYAQLSSTGVGAWSSTTPYPTNVEVTSCSTYNGYLYCVGGFNGLPNSKRIANVYFAQISGSGVGSWQSGSNFPYNIDQHKCSAFSGYLYCIGGDIGNTYPYNGVYMTSISSTGTGSWIASTPYPIGIENQGGCVAYNSNIYCITGRSNGNPMDNVSYSELFPINTVSILAGSGNLAFTVSNQLVSSVNYVPAPPSGSSIAGNTTSITFSPSPSLSIQYSPELYGQNDLITATTVPTDGVKLLIDGISEASSTGTITYNANTLAVGSHTIQAEDTNSGKYSQLLTLNVSRSVSSIYCTAGENSSLSIINRTYSGILSNSGVNNFSIAPDYPIRSEFHTCVSNSGYIYCLGGKDAAGSFLNATYSAPLYYNSTGSWIASIPYPINVVIKGGCVAYTNYIYCSGGKDAAGIYLNSSYFASLSSGNIGTWTSTTAYPTNTDFNNCVTSGGYIYCTRGEGTGNIYLSGSYYASASSSGIGSWTTTTPYPTNSAFGSCAAYNNYIYCLGGSIAGVITNSAYYASLSSSGIGTWHQTTAYPANLIFTSCVSANSYVFCTGGSSSSGGFLNNTYYAQLSSSGIGAWKNTARYPAPTELEECVAQQFESSSFAENGLPLSSLWNVTYSSITSKSTSNIITTATVPGDYSYTIPNQTVNSAKYTPSPALGSAVAGNTTSITFTGTFPLKSISFSSSNSLIEETQYQTLNAVVSGGATPYTYNFLVYNAIGSPVTNALYSTSSTSNTFTYSQFASWGSGKFTANVIITDSESPTASVSNSLTYGSNTFLIAPTPFSSPNTIGQGSNSILTENVPSTGTSPYTYQWLEEPPGTISYSAISGATSNTYTFATSGSTPTGIYNFSIQVTDSATTKVTSISSPTSVNVTAATCTISLTPTSINFGQVLPDQNYATSKYISDMNGGGTNAYLYIYGSNWINATNTLNNFYVSNTVWNPSSLSSYGGNELALTSTNTLILIQAGKTSNVFIGASVPSGQAAALYSQTLTITNAC